MRLAQASASILMLSIGIGLFGCAESAPEQDDSTELGTTQSALIGAPLDTEHLFAVGVCTGVPNADGSCPPRGTPNTSRCTGTLVGPNLVLTARHCVERLGAPSDPGDVCTSPFNGTPINSSVYITAGDSVLQPNNTWYQVTRIDRPSGTNGCTDDFVLMTLGQRVTGVKPAGIDLRRDIVQNPPTSVAIVGRGRIKQRYDPNTFELVEADDGGAFRRFRGSIPFTCASNVDGGCTVDDYWNDPPIFYFRAGQFGYGPASASGDSGAGVYDHQSIKDKSFLVLGVHSTSTMAADGTSSGGQAVRLQLHAPLIRQVVRQAAAAGGYPVPLWAS